MWNQKSLAEALSISVAAEFEAFSVAIDSRKIEQGAIFVAIVGPNQDGHNYIAQAINSGAVLCLVEREDMVPLGVPYILVPSAMEALRHMASYARARIEGKVIAVTGSVGKTTVKEMLRCVLDKQGETYANYGNLNNHYGVPLTLANMPASTEFAIIEMGMSATGEILELTLLAKPDVAIITNVESVHSEFFSSVAAIAEAKAEIIAGLPAGGTVVINMDNSYRNILEVTASVKKARVLGFSIEAKSDFKLLQLESYQDHIEVVADCVGKIISYPMKVRGKHLILNSLATLAAVHAIGAEVEFAASQMQNFHPIAGRGLVYNFSKVDITIIDESYNASPASMIATIEATAQRRQDRNRIIVALGDMKELGHGEVEMHIGLMESLLQNKIDAVYTVGPLSKSLFEKLPKEMAAIHCDDSAQLANILPGLLKSGDILLIKGSLSMGMKKVLDAVLSHLGE